MQAPRESQGQFVVDTRPGAFLHTTHTERTVKVYAVLESELKHISLLNTLATVLFSVGSFGVAIVGAILVDWVMAPESTELSRTATFLLVLCGILALVGYGSGIAAICHGKSEWKEIGIGSKERPPAIGRDISK